MTILFRLFYFWILFPFFFFSLCLLALFNKKVAEGLKARIYKKSQPNIKKGAVWIHASSGEFEYAKPLITEIKKQYPETPILVTYFSPTYAKNIENFKGVDMSLPLPLDLPGPLSQLIRTYQPRGLLFARTDLWPELLYQCQQFKVPTYLFSAVINTQASLITKIWREFLMRKLSNIFLVSQKDFDALPEDLQKKSEVLGDTRFDQVFARLENPKPLPTIFNQTHQRVMAVAGSTWPEDEDVLTLVMGQTKDLGVHWILAPHEPTEPHLAALEKKLHTQGFVAQRLSAWRGGADKDLAATNAVTLIDRVGILAELYTQADIAFVGGSFKKKVHSVMEPLAAGCVTFVGPLHTNNGEALLFKDKPLAQYTVSPVQAVTDAKDFAEKLRMIDTQYLSKDVSLKNEIKTEIAFYKGATPRLLEKLRSIF